MSPLPRQVYVVIGGEGFLGRAVVLDLLKRNASLPADQEPHEIRVLDIRHVNKSDDDLAKLKFCIGDICDLEFVRESLRGATTVFHTASPLVTAPAKVHKAVNIDGTSNVIEACVQEGVPNLVYTSSASVIFNGQPMINGDETTPYAQPFADYYSETKSIGEKMVLDANGRELEGGAGKFLTCAIRPSGIYGPGDRQTTPGCVGAFRKKTPIYIQIGDNTNLTDFTDVANVVHGHMLAADRIVADREYAESKIGGEVFIVTNDAPTAFWSVMRAFWAQTGPVPSGPWIVVPTWLCQKICSFMQILVGFGLLKREAPFFFGLTYTERYYNIQKAKTVLGYRPIVSQDEGIRIAVQSFLAAEQEAAANANKTN
ncbi:hypothetical protein GQ42DRAFT_163401 [Ramicandelaber brevisporus]|nr:hypothetical protein GQ42DRAFT_163401 [Ramicandelaber brevisporus]